VIVEFDEVEPKRLDQFLAQKLTFLSRTQVANMIKDGLVRVDGDEAKPSLKLKGSESIEVDLPKREWVDLLPEDIPLEIIHEEEDFLAVVKPQGMLSHPVGTTFTGTLVNAMLFHCQGKLSGMIGVQRPGIVHRLDKDTSGLMIIAKTDFGLKSFAKMFAQHQIDKRYLAISKGYFESEKIIINAPIGRDIRERWKMAVTSEGREAISKLTVLEKLRYHSLVEIKLITGRTHQIRVHMSYMGHPILGDPVYGGLDSQFDLPGQMLHCTRLTFDFNERHYDLSAAPPTIFQMTLEKLKIPNYFWN